MQYYNYLDTYKCFYMEICRSLLPASLPDNMRRETMPSEHVWTNCGDSLVRWRENLVIRRIPLVNVNAVENAIQMRVPGKESDEYRFDLYMAA